MDRFRWQSTDQLHTKVGDGATVAADVAAVGVAVAIGVELGGFRLL